ncbi:hypothetical protein PENTCL1PPCAC_24303 [Pristionchus entomophagus]|uniref:Uncharacterized protein n=1 Tax=Pristionchus entomophagus TaxID=358040 RepID=A0AAV5U6U3_9BILA|nr:hypothetical protein PENTCL1PPCAC_24303 [Pristionchus entomophagus]
MDHADDSLPVLSAKDLNKFEVMNITPESNQASVSNKCDSCGYSFTLESAKPKPWKCDTCSGFWPVPRCGGGWIFNGIEYTIKNTCSIDAFLAILISQNKKNPTQYLKIGTGTKYEKCLRAVLLSLDVDFAKEQLVEYCYGHRLKETTYNLFGAETENLSELTNSASLLILKTQCITCQEIKYVERCKFESSVSSAAPWLDFITHVVYGSSFGKCKVKANGDIAGEM